MSSPAGADLTGAVVSARFVELVDELALRDSRIRRQATGSLKGMRVTLRRIRSLLSTFGPLYEPAAVAPLRARLKWVAGELAGARDAEVVQQRVLSLATTADEEALAGRIGAELVGEDSEGVVDAVAVLDSERYARTLQEVTAFTMSAQDAEDQVAEQALLRAVRRDWKRVRRRADVAERTEDEAERQVALHAVRKAAKRLRYSTEALVPAYGDDAARLAKRAKRVQSALGDLQDSVVAQVQLRGLVETADWTAEETFLLGVFGAREEARAAEAEEAYVQAWQRLARKKNRRWLR